jgi:hypothetical protein
MPPVVTCEIETLKQPIGHPDQQDYFFITLIALAGIAGPLYWFAGFQIALLALLAVAFALNAMNIKSTNMALAMLTLLVNEEAGEETRAAVGKKIIDRLKSA